MDDAAPRRLIIPEFTADGSGSYQLSPAEFLRPEAVYMRISFEGPGIVAATVTYADPALLNFSEFAVMSTLPSLVEGEGGTHTVQFTFAVDVAPILTYFPRDTPVAPPSLSLFDPTVFTAGLPDTVLEPKQIIALTAGGLAPDGTALTFTLETATIWAEVVNPEGPQIEAVVPPYTAQAFDYQVAQQAA